MQVMKIKSLQIIRCRSVYFLPETEISANYFLSL